jgi:nitrous oxidase accessory protein
MIVALALALGLDTVRVSASDASSLRDALETAKHGSVIVVGPGSYAGPWVVDRPLTIVGQGRPTLSGDHAGSVVRIVAPGVTLRGFRVTAGGDDRDRDDAGVLVEADRAVLDDLQVDDVLHGVYLKRVRDAVLRRVVIRGRVSRRPNDRGDGIHFYWSRGVRAEQCDIADVRDGMYFSYSDSTVVLGNRVARSRYGLHYMFSHHNRFEDNLFTESAAGTSIMNSSDVVVRRNVFAWNRGIGSFGLLQQTTERIVLEDNVFVGNHVGLFFDGATDGAVVRNLVAGNFVGLELYQSAARNSFTGNAVVANTYPASGAGEGNRFCVEGRGNYWEGVRPYDLDGDGAGDAPARLGSPLVELSRGRAALRLFLTSPAARALEWAERSFPVFQIRAVADECPLVRFPNVAAAPPAPDYASPRAAHAARLAAGTTLLLGLGLFAASRPRSNGR